MNAAQAGGWAPSLLSGSLSIAPTVGAEIEISSFWPLNATVDRLSVSELSSASHLLFILVQAIAF